jgi:RND superfamily putative drug exporter
MFGIGLAIAVLVDAMIIRSTLLPALMVLLGRANWWPGGRRAPREAEADDRPLAVEAVSVDTVRVG